MFEPDESANSQPALTKGSLKKADHAMAENKVAVKTFEFKIRDNKHFIAGCERTLESCRQLYNAALEHRITYYRNTGKSMGLIEQSRQLTDARKEMPEVALIYRDIQSDVLDRLDKAYRAFFRRIRNGEAPGFPRFRGKHRYSSFGCSRRLRDPFPIKGDRLVFPGVGYCRIRLSIPLSEIGRCRYIRMIRRADGWYVQLVCEVARSIPLPETGEIVGVDVGLAAFATLSTGETIERRRFVKDAEDDLAKAQHKVSKKKKGSNRRGAARDKVARKHLKLSRCRRRFHYDVANYFINRFDKIILEDLNIKGLAGGMLAKAVLDVAWASFFAILICKAECAGRQIEKVNPAKTSQVCARCGHEVRKTLSDRWHDCPNCGLSLDRDHNSALNILGLREPKVAEGQLRSWLNSERDGAGYIDPKGFIPAESGHPRRRL